MNESWRRLYPFESHYLTVGDQRMHFVDEGQGEPVVMVHGNPTWSFYWRNLVSAFSQQRRALAVDHIGCGLSDKPQRYDYCLRQHIDNLVDWWTQLDLRRITLVVHDWGGAIGLGAALRAPERISRIVIFNTGAFPPPFIPMRIRLCRVPLLGVFGVRGLNLFARAALRMAMHDPALLGPEVKRGLLAPYNSWSNRVAIHRFVRDIPTKPSSETWALLEQIEDGVSELGHCPAHIIWGMKDWCFNSDCLSRMSKLFPNADIQRVENAGHYIIEEATEEVIRSVEAFLSKESLPIGGGME